MARIPSDLWAEIITSFGNNKDGVVEVDPRGDGGTISIAVRRTGPLVAKDQKVWKKEASALQWKNTG